MAAAFARPSANELTAYCAVHDQLEVCRHSEMIIAAQRIRVCRCPSRPRAADIDRHCCEMQLEPARADGIVGARDVAVPGLGRFPQGATEPSRPKVRGGRDFGRRYRCVDGVAVTLGIAKQIANRHALLP